jgi:hypothetical protein
MARRQLDRDVLPRPGHVPEVPGGLDGGPSPHELGLAPQEDRMRMCDQHSAGLGENQNRRRPPPLEIAAWVTEIATRVTKIATDPG